MNARKTGYLDFMRILACIMVVGVHVSALCLNQLNVESLNFKIMNAFDCLFILGVPLFVMISGALLLSPEYMLDIKKLYFHKAFPLAFLYFFWLLFYNTDGFIADSKLWSFETVKKEIVLESLLGRGCGPLWFLPMIVSLYFCVPVLKAFATNQKICVLFCGLHFVLTIFLPTVLLFEFPYRTIVESIYNQFYNSMFAGYIGYFVMGHVLHTFLPQLKKKHLVILCLCAVVSMVVEIYVCNLYSIKTGKLSTILNNPLTCNAYITCICIFAFAAQTKIERTNLLKTGVSLTLGIYLLHPFTLRIFERIGGNTLFVPAFLSIPIITLLIAVVTMCIVFVIKKIPVLRWFI